MANVQHSALTGAEVHEEKYISSAGTSDAGKVVTPDDVTAGQGELRYLTYDEITSREESVHLYFPDISSALTKYVVADFDGTIEKVWSVIDTAIASGSDTTLTVSINGTNVSPSDITVTQSGSAAGDVDSVTPTSLNTFSEGDTLEVTSDGGAGTSCAAMITFNCSRT